MIDTDNYEGHTPAPWTWRGETIDGDGWTVCYMEHPHVHGRMNETDAQLIADAPLLLAEVERLREELNAKIALITDVDTMIDESWDFCITQDDWNELVNKHYGEEEE